MEHELRGTSSVSQKKKILKNVLLQEWAYVDMLNILGSSYYHNASLYNYSIQ
jgi:hypothetical protein